MFTRGAAETVRNKDLFLLFLIEVQYMNEIQSSLDIKTFCPHHYSHKKDQCICIFYENCRIDSCKLTGCPKIASQI